MEPFPRLFPSLSVHVDVGFVPASPRLLYVWQQRPCAVAIFRSTPPLQPRHRAQPQQRCRRLHTEQRYHWGGPVIQQNQHYNKTRIH